jgi:hypothetical protein
MIVGDPIDGLLFISVTTNCGETWKKRQWFRPIDGEACFAASGTNILCLKKLPTEIVTGGKESRFINYDKEIKLPIVQGKETTGANSIAILKGSPFVIVGGDFADDKRADSNCVIVSYKNEITIPHTPPHGYRSCVEYITER